MNIIQAIKSGKPFKRSSWSSDYVRPPFANLNLPAKDLVADDWEVEPTVVTITREQFDQAWDENIPIGESYGETMRYLLAKALGF